ncbi:hypothetical protein BC938DRAFT_478355 [Jimgerdemannia flammicorona]|uniref:Uncharacterized protein n=1 Tax=Jimgerdemannia flammicorona TaxID=994334 RepID=A0A433QYH8_9FUNG|nr:hypothetical protein BC938DRAFT_478355 [Jimgerdemannia flammicorona]
MESINHFTQNQYHTMKFTTALVIAPPLRSQPTLALSLSAQTRPQCRRTSNSSMLQNTLAAVASSVIDYTVNAKTAPGDLQPERRWHHRGSALAPPSFGEADFTVSFLSLPNFDGNYTGPNYIVSVLDRKLDYNTFEFLYEAAVVGGSCFSQIFIISRKRTISPPIYKAFLKRLETQG